MIGQFFPLSQTLILIKTPIAAQGSYFNVVQLGASTMRVTGYGTANGTANETQQTATGPDAGSTGTELRYVVDTEPANSGSPVIRQCSRQCHWCAYNWSLSI